VAVVGSRAALPEALTFARDLGSALARAGAVVVSGGAVGVDAHAHEGALDANGRTWAIAGTGQDHCYPPEHAALFDRIGKGPGAMVWPFEAHYGHRSGFLARNRVLVALADAVVVVQAGIPSGALHAAAWARKLDKPLWVVPAAPWMKEFAGSRLLLEKGAGSSVRSG
jgi:DNA processing protein